MTPEPQSNFFGDLGPRVIKPDKSRKEPALWFRELRLLSRWAPENETPAIRSFELKPGLNILWAEPEDPVANHEMYQDGLAGHATGKTLFCRILRHLLGETYYGAKELRDGVEREFPELIAIAHIRVAEESWIVGRGMTGPCGDFAVRGGDVDAVLRSEPPASGFDAFTRVVQEKCCGALAPLDEDGSFRNLLPWLARDQEARFANLVSWRDSESEGDNPKTKVSDQHLLMRALLDIFDPKETELRAELDRLSADAEADTARKPEAQREFDREQSRLPTPLADVKLALSDFETLEALLSHLESAADVREASITQLREQPEPENVRLAREAYFAARLELTKIQTEASGLKIEISQLEKSQREHLLTIHKIRLGGIGDAGRISAGFCPNGIGEAQRRGCVQLKETPQVDIADLERQAQELDQRIQAKKSRFAQLESMFERLEADVAAKEKAFKVIQAESQKVLMGIVREYGQFRSSAQRVRDTIEARKNLKDIERKLERTGPKQEALRKSLIALRDEQLDKVNQLSDIFGDVVRAVMGASVRARLKVSDAGFLQTLAERNGALRGAALDTIKTLAFDLAAVVASIEGRGNHPRFLIHDGPREADMARVIYEKFFLFAEGMEKAFGANGGVSFQYVLTTTTNPPTHMQRGSKWLLGDVLTSRTADGRLLRKNV